MFVFYFLLFIKSSNENTIEILSTVKKQKIKLTDIKILSILIKKENHERVNLTIIINL
jgi:hypothetical protein